MAKKKMVTIGGPFLKCEVVNLEPGSMTIIPVDEAKRKRTGGTPAMFVVVEELLNLQRRVSSLESRINE